MKSSLFTHIFRRILLPSWWAWAFVGVWVFVSVFSDFIANDRPITCIVSQERHWPIFQKIGQDMGLIDHDTIQPYTNFAQSESAIWPPIRYAYNTNDALIGIVAPNEKHILGTHDLGRDVAAGLISGARKALVVGVVSTLLAAFIGLVLGSLGSLSRQNTEAHRIFSADAILLRILEIYQSVPSLLILLVLAGLLQKTTIWHISVIIAILGWPMFAQLVRTELRRIRQLDYIESAHALGLGHTRIFLKHALPNALGSTLVAAAFAAGHAVSFETALSFLGIGISPDEVSWGSMLGQIRSSPTSWWLAVYPGLALFGVMASLYTIGQQLRRR